VFFAACTFHIRQLLPAPPFLRSSNHFSTTFTCVADSC
jgi:hypothetical protein